MSNFVMIYTTWPDVNKAQAAGRALVEAGLAACVNILPAMQSIYRWEGKIEESHECVMLIKTRASLCDAVEKIQRTQHPYDVPAFMVLPVSATSDDYGNWLTNMTAAQSTSREP